jgi:hypothetical protein
MPTGHREEATASTLIGSGSGTAAAASADSKEGALQASLASVSAVLMAVTQVVTPLKDLVADHLPLAAMLLVCVFGYLGVTQFARGRWLLARRLDEHRRGVR